MRYFISPIIVMIPCRLKSHGKNLLFLIIHSEPDTFLRAEILVFWARNNKWSFALRAFLGVFTDQKCLFFIPSALQPNLLSFPQQQGSLLLSQPGPSLASQAVGRSGLPGSSVEPHLDVPQHLQVAKHLTPAGASEEPSDLEELEKFAKTFKQRRIKLGFTQVRVRGWGGFGAELCVAIGHEKTQAHTAVLEVRKKGSLFSGFNIYSFLRVTVDWRQCHLSNDTGQTNSPSNFSFSIKKCKAMSYLQQVCEKVHYKVNIRRLRKS
uniref:POU-specific domain-containing protein n=1 Tax=Junco hyemalis TaxID=40217 RepID=A0A8C5IRT8_JUNHY